MLSPLVIFCYLAGIYGDFIEIRKLPDAEKRRQTWWALALWGWVFIALLADTLIRLSWKVQAFLVLGFGMIVLIRWAMSKKGKMAE